MNIFFFQTDTATQMQMELSEEAYLAWYPLRFLSPSQAVQNRVAKYARSISGPPFSNISQFFAMATFWSYQISRRNWCIRSEYRDMQRSVTNPGKICLSFCLSVCLSDFLIFLFFLLNFAIMTLSLCIQSVMDDTFS